MYEPGKGTPCVGKTLTLDFKEVNHPTFGLQWNAEEDVLFQGSTKYVVDHNTSTRPTLGHTKWKFRVTRILTDVAAKTDDQLYYRIIAVELLSEVDAPSVTPSKRIESQVRIESSRRVQDSEEVSQLPPPRVLSGISFIRSMSGEWTFSFQRADGVLEVIVLDPGSHRVSALRGNDGRQFSIPLDVRIDREIDVNPKYQKFQASPVVRNAESDSAAA